MRGAAPEYLLTGIARCDQCGGPITVYRKKNGQVNASVYICSYQHHRVKAVCANTTKQPVHEVDAAVIAAVNRLITPRSHEKDSSKKHANSIIVLMVIG